MKIRKPQKSDLKKAVLDEESLESIIGLCLDVLYVCGFTVDDETDDSLEEMFGPDSLCSRYISLKDFKTSKKEDRVRERIVMNVLVPEIIRHYENNTGMNGPHKRGIREFFEDLKEDKYYLYDVQSEYGISQSTLKNHRKIDPFKDDDSYGLTHIRKGYMWRALPKE